MIFVGNLKTIYKWAIFTYQLFKVNFWLSGATPIWRGYLVLSFFVDVQHRRGRVKHRLWLITHLTPSLQGIQAEARKEQVWEKKEEHRAGWGCSYKTRPETHKTKSMITKTEMKKWYSTTLRKDSRDNIVA